MFPLVRLVLYGFLLYDLCISQADDVSGISTLSNRKTFLFNPCNPALFTQNSTIGNTNSSQQLIPVDIEIYGNFTDLQIKPVKSYGQLRNFSCSAEQILYNKSFSSPLQLFVNQSSLNEDLVEILNSNEFCIENIRNLSIQFMYCSKDPCFGQKKCINKCCPPNFSYDLRRKSCIADFQTLNIILRNHSGITPGDISQFKIRHSLLHSPNFCPEGKKTLLDPSVKIKDEFYFLPSGNLYIPGIPLVEHRETSGYCVDNFVNINNTISMKAVKCLVTFKEEISHIWWIFPYFLFTSSVFLIVTIFVYCIVPELRRNLHGLTLICHGLSLTITFIQMGIIQLKGSTMEQGWCVSSAIILHFFFLSSFTWLNVMGYDTWRKITSMNITNGITIRKDSKWLKFGLYSLYAWGVPSLFAITGAVLSLQTNPPENLISPRFGMLRCWFYGSQEKFVYLYGPIIFVLTLNILFFIPSVLYIRGSCRAVTSSVQNKRTNLQKQRLYAIIRLFILMGISWITEIISWAAGGSPYIWVVTDLFNILMGVFIFIQFVLKRSVLKPLNKTLQPILRKLPIQLKCCTIDNNDKQAGVSSTILPSLSFSTVNRNDQINPRPLTVHPKTKN